MSVASRAMLVTSLTFGQMPGHPPWKVMCKASTLIVIGVAGPGVWVVHPDKMDTVTRPISNGTEIVELPNP